MAIDKSDYRCAFATVFTHAEELLLSAKQHPNTLKQYLKSWQEIAEKAAEVDNLALQDVILLFIDASGLAFKKTKDAANLSEEQWQLLKKWDNLFARYINAPDDQQIALDLIKCLNDPLLAMGLEPEDELMLLDGFQPVIKQLTSYSKPEAANEDELIAEKMSIWEKLTVLLTEVDLNIQETLAQRMTDPAEIHVESLRHYLESWSVIAKIIDAENEAALSRITDIVALFIEFSCQLFNQTNNLNHQQQELLKQWHYLFGLTLKYMVVSNLQEP
jgi:hypothetical protein